jgi:hypothetical protein
MDKPLGEKQATWVLKWTVLVAGLLSMGLVFVLNHLGTIFEVTPFYNKKIMNHDQFYVCFVIR